MGLGLAPATPAGGQAQPSTVTVVPTTLPSGDPFTITATGCVVPPGRVPIAQLHRGVHGEPEPLAPPDRGRRRDVDGDGRGRGVGRAALQRLPLRPEGAPTGISVIIDVERPDTFVSQSGLRLVGTDCVGGTEAAVVTDPVRSASAIRSAVAQRLGASTREGDFVLAARDRPAGDVLRARRVRARLRPGPHRPRRGSADHGPVPPTSPPPTSTPAGARGRSGDAGRRPRPPHGLTGREGSPRHWQSGLASANGRP